MENISKKEETVNTVLKIMELQEKADTINKELKKLKRTFNIKPKHVIDSKYDVEKVCRVLYRDDEEKVNEVYAECLSKNPLLAKKYFINSYFSKGFDETEDINARNAAFNCILEYPELIFDVIDYEEGLFTSMEKKTIYLKHREYYYDKSKKSIKACFTYCKAFKYWIGFDEKLLLVDKIISNKREDLAKQLTNNTVQMNFPENLTDKLIAFLVAQKLLHG